MFTSAENNKNRKNSEGKFMLKDLVWQMFKNTGNIDYFIQYRSLNEQTPDFYTEAGSDIALDGEKCRTSKPEEWLSGK